MIEKRGYQMQISYEMLASFAAPSGPPQVKIETPKSAEWLDERDTFRRQYEDLVAYGEESGFLDSEPCYECGGELVITKHVTDVRWEEAK